MFRALILRELAAAVAVVGVCGHRRRAAAETRGLPKLPSPGPSFSSEPGRLVA